MKRHSALCGLLIFTLCLATAEVAPLSKGAGRDSGDFQPTIVNNAPPPSPPPRGMVWIPGGEFSMGSEDPRMQPSGGHEAMADARPIHRVYVDAFWMDATDVTNAQFARFVAATGYVTVAERKPSAAEFPEAKPGDLVPGSIVFTAPKHPISLDDSYQWWRYVPGANWRHPTGPGSSISNRNNYPVVQIAYEDATAYAKWAHGRLPSEAEWEFAARGGLAGKTYVWGDNLRPDHRWMANTHQGHFPDQDLAFDGFAGISPVAKYPANAYGLFDMAGNVWQWVSDWYRADYYVEIGHTVARNPPGPASSFDSAEPDAKKRVQRGGSFLCTEAYCTRYMVGARGKGEVNSASNHIGFRCVRDTHSPARSIKN